jgi:hypothetical protein
MEMMHDFREFAAGLFWRSLILIVVGCCRSHGIAPISPKNIVDD